MNYEWMAVCDGCDWTSSHVLADGASINFGYGFAAGHLCRIGRKQIASPTIAVAKMLDLKWWLAIHHKN
jgi:hypothetical protein